jgi:hypothetical protein
MALFRPAAKDQPTFSISEDDPWWEPPALRDATATPIAQHPRFEAEVDLTDSKPTGRVWLHRGPIAPGVSHLMLLRGFVAFGWLRAAADKIGDEQWWDGSAVTAFLTGGAAHEPIAGFAGFADSVLLAAPAIVALLVLVAEITIGVGVLTGIRFDAALGMGIVLSAAFLAAGQINPAAFYLIIQLALLGSPAGRTWAIEPWAPPTFMRWAPWALGAAVLAVAWSIFSADGLSPDSVADPAAVLGFVGLFAMAAITVLWFHDRQASA